MTRPNRPGDPPSTAPSRLHHQLTSDGGLVLRADAELLPSIRRWIPRFLDSPGIAGGPSVATIDLRADTAPLPTIPPSPPTLRLASVRAWVQHDHAMLRAADAATGGEIDLAARRAILQAPPPGPDADAGMDAFTLLTISSALLLARAGRALLHSAAVVAREGHAWLLVGDTHAGKTTTTLNLIRAGHGFLSDDHVVLGGGPAADRLQVEGWPRTFHVDEGWSRGEITGRRVDFDPLSLGPERWRRSAPLAGLLFPRIEAEQPTATLPLSPADALARVIRQSPWFMADRAAASGVLGLLKSVVQHPAFELRLGRDSYADPQLLDDRLHSLARR